MNYLLLPIKVFPVPGGPNNKIPLGGPRKPLKMSLQEETKDAMVLMERPSKMSKCSPLVTVSKCAVATSTV